MVVFTGIIGQGGVNGSFLARTLRACADLRDGCQLALIGEESVLCVRRTLRRLRLPQANIRNHTFRCSFLRIMCCPPRGAVPLRARAAANLSRMPQLVSPLLAAVVVGVLTLQTTSASASIDLATPGSAEQAEPTYWYNKKTGETKIESPLPKKHHDDKTNRDYWSYHAHGETTIESSWETPEVMSWYKAKSKEDGHDNQTYYVNSKTGETTWEEPLMFQWVELKRNSVFYHNTITGETQRERPEEMGFKDEKTGRIYWRDSHTGEATWESEHWWTEVKVVDEHNRPDADGRVYWVNEKTKESTWEQPAVMGWQEWNDPVVSDSMHDDL